MRVENVKGRVYAGWIRHACRAVARPVDYALRRRRLSELDGLEPDEIWLRIDDGLPKLWLIRRALRLRRDRALFAWRPKSSHVLAFARGERAITVVPRLVIQLGGEWGETTFEIPRGVWHNELTGEETAGGKIGLADLLKRFPVALLTRRERS